MLWEAVFAVLVIFSLYSLASFCQRERNVSLVYQAGLRLTQNRHTASCLSSKVEVHSKSTHIILSIKQVWGSLKIDTQLLFYQAGLRLTQNRHTASYLSSKVEAHSKSTHIILSIKQGWDSLKINTRWSLSTHFRFWTANAGANPLRTACASKKKMVFTHSQKCVGVGPNTWPWTVISARTASSWRRAATISHALTTDVRRIDKHTRTCTHTHTHAHAHSHIRTHTYPSYTSTLQASFSLHLDVWGNVWAKLMSAHMLLPVATCSLKIESKLCANIYTDENKLRCLTFRLAVKRLT